MRTWLQPQTLLNLLEAWKGTSFSVGNTEIWSSLVHSQAPLSPWLVNRGDRAVLKGQLLLNKDV